MQRKASIPPAPAKDHALALDANSGAGGIEASRTKPRSRVPSGFLSPAPPILPWPVAGRQQATAGFFKYPVAERRSGACPASAMCCSTTRIKSNRRVGQARVSDAGPPIESDHQPNPPPRPRPEMAQASHGLCRSSLHFRHGDDCRRLPSVWGQKPYSWAYRAGLPHIFQTASVWRYRRRYTQTANVRRCAPPPQANSREMLRMKSTSRGRITAKFGRSSAVVATWRTSIRRCPALWPKPAGTR